MNLKIFLFLEGKLYNNYSYRRYFDNVNTFKKFILKTDPTATSTNTGKFTDWLLKNKDEITDFNKNYDFNKIYKALEQFIRLKKGDINKYSVFQILQLLKQKSRKQLKTENAFLLFNKNGNKFYRIKTFEASKLYGKGTSWCISRKISDWNDFKKYKIYFLITPKTKICILVKPTKIEIWTYLNECKEGYKNKRNFIRKYHNLIPDIEKAIGKKLITEVNIKKFRKELKKKSEIPYMNRFLKKYWGITNKIKVELLKEKNGIKYYKITGRNINIKTDDYSLKLPNNIVIEEVNGNFDCSYNHLRSLEGSPKIITGYFNCSNNHLFSLKGMPKKIGKDFYVQDNFLEIKNLDVNGFLWKFGIEDIEIKGKVIFKPQLL